jgi:hypothetical protein
MCQDFQSLSLGNVRLHAVILSICFGDCSLFFQVLSFVEMEMAQVQMAECNTIFIG